jgi:hypothetical protein
MLLNTVRLCKHKRNYSKLLIACKKSDKLYNKIIKNLFVEYKSLNRIEINCNINDQVPTNECDDDNDLIPLLFDIPNKNNLITIFPDESQNRKNNNKQFEKKLLNKIRKKINKKGHKNRYKLI